VASVGGSRNKDMDVLHEQKKWDIAKDRRHPNNGIKGSSTPLFRDLKSAGESKGYGKPMFRISNYIASLSVCCFLSLYV
jgi:hypothetical protein